MGLFDGCLLISDIDGTLLNSSEIPQRNVDAIERFVNGGGIFALATGRSADGCRETLSKVKTNAPAIVVNGTVLYDFSKNQVIKSVGLDDATRDILYSVMENPSSEIGIEIHSRDFLVDINVTREVELHNKYEKLYPRDITLQQMKNEEWSKVLFTFETEGNDKKFKEFLISKGVNESQIVFTNAHLADGVHHYVEIMPLGIHKGNGVKWLCELFNVEKEKIYCIGDYYNDVPLLKAAGVSAVTSTAPQELLNLANYVSCDVKDGAVAQFIEYIEERMLVK